MVPCSLRVASSVITPPTDDLTSFVSDVLVLLHSGSIPRSFFSVWYFAVGEIPAGPALRVHLMPCTHLDIGQANLLLGSVTILKLSYWASQ